MNHNQLKQADISQIASNMGLHFPPGSQQPLYEIHRVESPIDLEKNITRRRINIGIV